MAELLLEPPVYTDDERRSGRVIVPCGRCGGLVAWEFPQMETPARRPTSTTTVCLPCRSHRP
jgi:hypothetical protein